MAVAQDAHVVCGELPCDVLFSMKRATTVGVACGYSAAVWGGRHTRLDKVERPIKRRPGSVVLVMRQVHRQGWSLLSSFSVPPACTHVYGGHRPDVHAIA